MGIKNKLGFCILCAGVVLTLTACGKKAGSGHIEAGMAAVQGLDYETALNEFEAALVNGEEERLLYRGQGLAYLGLTDYAGAAASFETALTYSGILTDSLDYDINYYLATAYYKNGEPEKAAAVYDAIIGMDAGAKTAYYLRGAVTLESGDYEKAAADFDKAVSLDKTDYSQLLSIYQVLADNGYRQLGEEYLNQALEKTMPDYEKGRICYYLGDYESAGACLERAREGGGEEVILYLGKTYEALGDYNYASGVYTSYLEAHADSEVVYNQLGLCKLKMQDYKAALQAFQSGLAVENNSMLQTLQFNEIAAYEYLGEYKKASVLMETYLKNYPDDETAQRENAFLKSR